MSEMPSMEPDEFEIPAELPSTTRTTRGARGRPKGKTTTTTVTRQILTDPEDEEKPPEMTFASLFDAGPDDSNNEVVARVRVFRSEPREGHLGYIDDMDATETFIKEHWGGSTYRLEGVNSRGRIVRVRTIAVAGDPIFVGEAFEAQWRRQKGLGPRGASTGESMSMKDMLAVIEAREQALRTELAAKEERDRRERTERDESRRRDEREFLLQREQSQREWDERKRRDTEESDRRRAQEQDARDERRELRRHRARRQRQPARRRRRLRRLWRQPLHLANGARDRSARAVEHLGEVLHDRREQVTFPLVALPGLAELHRQRHTLHEHIGGVGGRLAAQRLLDKCYRVGRL